MSETLERYCPSCEEYRTFWQVANTELHLGTKVKWRCSECDHGFVRIDGEVDTGATG
jgi:rubredoxin